MDSIVIQMTGLLLLVPPNQAGNSMHVVSPSTMRLQDPHVTWIAFAGDSTRHCIRYGSGICVVNMDGWSMELGRPGGGVSSPGPPRHATNLTHVSGEKVKSAHLGQHAGGSVRSRIGLRGGGVAETCSLGVWEYEPVGSSPPRRDTMANLLTWTIPDFPAGGLVLVRDSLLRHPGDTPRRQMIGTVRADADGAIELIVMHVPIVEANWFLEDIGARPMWSGIRTRKDASASAEALGDTFAHHFEAYYDLLGAQQGKRPIPWLVDRVRDPLTNELERCQFRMVASLPTVLSEQRRPKGGLETLTCMVASADPQ